MYINMLKFKGGVLGERNKKGILGEDKQRGPRRVATCHDSGQQNYSGQPSMGVPTSVISTSIQYQHTVLYTYVVSVGMY